MRMMEPEQRLEMIVVAAWETWTKNGLNLDDDLQIETTKTVQDAAADEYYVGINDADWLTGTLRRLRGLKKGELK